MTTISHIAAGRRSILVRIVACLLLLAFGGTAATAVANTIYKSVGPDGRIVYSDKPPAGNAEAAALRFTHAPASPLPEDVIRYRDELLKGAANRAANPPVRRAGVEIFTAEWCGYCRQAKAYLADKGIRYREYDIDTPEGKRAFARAGSASGIPLLLRQDRKVQGFSKARYDAVFGR